MRIAVLGASGFLGRRVVPRLERDGHQVVAVGRRRDVLPLGPDGEQRVVDLAAPGGPAVALEGVDAALYLVHSMDGGDGFAERDRAIAREVALAARAAGVERIVYVGGLGTGELSEHLASRQDVGDVLREHGPSVVELRAAVVLGAGSISFEMLRDLTERLPVMVCPRWIRTRVQPIAEGDLLDVVTAALSARPGVYEVGGPDVTTYRDMIATFARVRGLRPRRIIDVPLLTPRLSARWVDLVTPVDPQVSHALIESLSAEVVVRTPPAPGQLPVPALGIEEAIRTALDEQAAVVPDQVFDLPSGFVDGLYVMRGHADLDEADLPGAEADLRSGGGDLRWYGVAWAWRLRLLLGRLFGERLSLHRPPVVDEGATLDWWRVERLGEGRLVLGTDRWFCGEAWLGYDVRRAPRPHVTQVGVLRPKGLTGVVYWRLLWPIHLVVFELMAKRQARRAAMARRRLGAARG